MTTSSRPPLCLRCLIILYSLMTVIEGKTDRMVKPMTTLTSSDTSSRSSNQLHIAPGSTTNRLLTSPTDARSPRQPDAIAKTPWNTAASAAAGGSSSGRIIIRKTRQVDPLHSCIEAKCSGWKSSEYLNCIYHHCINGMESTSSRFGRDITGGKMVEGRQAERMVLWKRRMDGGMARMLQGKTQLGTRTFPEKIGQFERIGSGMSGQVLVRGSQEAEPFAPVVASVPGAFLSMGFPVGRRGFNDISDVCKERNCGPYQQTVEYFNCIENIVDCPTLLR